MIDITVVVIMVSMIYLGYKKGLVLSVFNFLSFFIAAAVAGMIYKPVARWLNSSNGIYPAVKESVSKGLGPIVTEALLGSADKARDEIIKSLNLPEFLTAALAANDTPVVYAILGAFDLEDYVSSFLAMIIVNIIAALIVFIMVLVIMRVAAAALSAAAEMPVVSTFNHVGGAIAGGALGVLIVWILLTIAVLFFTVSHSVPVNDLLQSSIAARFFQNNNIIFKAISSITF